MSASLSSQERQGLMLAAAFLRYPDQSMNALLAEAGASPEIAVAAAAEIHRNLAGFAGQMANLPLEAWQTEHVRVFDLASDTTPHLAWHVYGDTPDLGRAYAALLELYRDAGFEPEPGELPDTLPVVLEFLAVAPDWAGEVLLDGFAPAFRLLAARLSKVGSLYAPLVEAVNDLLGVEADPLPVEACAAVDSLKLPVNASTVKECAL